MRSVFAQLRARLGGYRPAWRAYGSTVAAAAVAAGLVGLGVGTRASPTNADPVPMAADADEQLGVRGGMPDWGEFVRRLREGDLEHPGSAASDDERRLRATAARSFARALAENGGYLPVRTFAWQALGDASRTTAVDRSEVELAIALSLSGEPTEMASYNGRPIRPVATMRMRVTAYSPDERSCGASADGITASGYSVFVNGGCLVAADPKVLPLGSLVSVPGYHGGAVVPVLDVGGAIKGERLDVLYPTHERAILWGVQDLVVTVWDYADGKPNGFRRLRRR
ncbi:MAG: Cell wall-binding protein YocH precursor [Planctomycetota bacterium]